MSLHQKYLRIISVLAGSGAVGLSLLLASTAPSAARPTPSGAEPTDTPKPRVSEQLSAIRDAVSELSAPETGAEAPGLGERLMAWGNWRNGGWGNGLRWLMWLTPIWLTCLLPMADRLASNSAGRRFGQLLLVISVFSVSYELWNPWRHPWIYDRALEPPKGLVTLKKKTPGGNVVPAASQ